MHIFGRFSQLYLSNKRAYSIALPTKNSTIYIPNLRTTYFPLSIHYLASSEKRLFMTAQKLFMTGFRVAT